MVILSGAAGGVVAVLAVFGAIILAALSSPVLRAWPAAWLEQHLFPDPNQINLKNSARKNTNTPGAARKVYRILAFGDSLTEGFTNGGSAFHPYAKRLGDTVYKQMPKDWHLEIEEQGESGERVLIGMEHRLQRTLDEHTAANRRYDWVLLLGGINDLAGDDSKAEEVMTGLDMLVQKCLHHGANVLLMTLLEVAMPEDRVEQQRQLLNKIIKDYTTQRLWDKPAAPGSSGKHRPPQKAAAAAAAGDSESNSNTVAQRRSKPQVHLFDLATALSYEQMDDEQRWENWDDGVHLTMVGYDHMGSLIADALLPLMANELQKIDSAAAAAAAAADQKGQ